MRYRDPVFRPPSEANSYLLHVTYGCSHNECTYCAMYRTKNFEVRAESEVFEDIELAASTLPSTRRVFLLDGDALSLSTRRLERVLEKLRACFPELQRVSAYSNASSILTKSDEELTRLSGGGLTLAYFGLETGDDVVNEAIVKGATVAEEIEAVRRAQANGIKASVMVLLGMGGRARSREHAEATGRALSEMDPRYISCLCVTPVEGTPLFDAVESGSFEPIEPEDTLDELEGILRNTEVSASIFRSNHASNWLPLGGRLPADREKLLEAVAAAKRGEVGLKPSSLRGL